MVSLGLHCFVQLSCTGLVVVWIPGCCWPASAFLRVTRKNEWVQADPPRVEMPTHVQSRESRQLKLASQLCCLHWSATCPPSFLSGEYTRNTCQRNTCQRRRETTLLLHPKTGDHPAFTLSLRLHVICVGSIPSTCMYASSMSSVLTHPVGSILAVVQLHKR